MGTSGPAFSLLLLSKICSNPLVTIPLSSSNSLFISSLLVPMVKVFPGWRRELEGGKLAEFIVEESRGDVFWK